MKSVLPSEACRITGWKMDLPKAGDVILEVNCEKRAKEVIRWRQEKVKESEKMAALKDIDNKRQIENEIYQQYRQKNMEVGKVGRVFASFNSDARKAILENEASYQKDLKLSVVIKTDVDGSLDALQNCLDTYDNEDVFLDVAKTGVRISFVEFLCILFKVISFPLIL